MALKDDLKTLINTHKSDNSSEAQMAVTMLESVVNRIERKEEMEARMANRPTPPNFANRPHNRPTPPTPPTPTIDPSGSGN